MNLHRKVFLRTTGLLALLVAGICVAMAVIVTKDCRDVARDNGRMVANFLAHRAGEFLLWDDREGIATLLEETVASQPIVAYAFLQRGGHTYASTFQGHVPQNLLLLHKPRIDSPEINDLQNRSDHRYYDVAASVPETNAILHLGLSRNAIEALPHEHLWIIGIIGSIVFVLGLTVTSAVAAGIAKEDTRIGELLVKSESQTRAILDASTDAVVQLDREMQVQWANSVALGLADGDLTGRKWHQALLGSGTACGDCPCQKALKTGKAEYATIRRPATSTSDEIIWEICGIPMKDESGNVAGVVDVARDVTKQKKAEEELQEYATALESTNIVLEELYEKVDAAAQAKNEFLANMSHEIRTPMTAILGYADVLIEEEVADNAPPRRIEALELIRRNGEFLLAQITNILDLSKIEAGKLQADMVDCNPIAVIDEVAALMGVRADAKGISLDVEYSGVMPGTIKCDPLRLRQILVNLLANAINFTDVGGVKLISHLVLGVDGSSALQFDVVDTGIGISPEQAQDLFTPFSQADSSVKKYCGGTGLGLVISRRLAEMLGGDITFSSRPGKGSTFTLTVETGSLAGVTMLSNPAGEGPAAERPTAATDEKEMEDGLPDNYVQNRYVQNRDSADPENAEDLSPGTQFSTDNEQLQVAAEDSTKKAAGDNPIAECELVLNARILLAEDGPDNRRLIEFFLKQAGADVTTVEDGSAACDAIQAAIERNRPFDLVLMDMQMPVMDGYEATRQLREAGYDAPIVALTAFAMEGDRQKCIDAGCDEYLAKPLKRDALLSTVHRYITAAAFAGGDV